MVQPDKGDLFRRYLTAQYRPATVVTYTYAYTNFLHWKQENRVENLTPADVMNYLETLPESARAVHAYAIKAYLEFYGKHDLASKVPVPRASYSMKLPTWIPEPVLMWLVREAPRPVIKAILAVGYDLALRLNELVILNRVPRPDTPYIDLETGEANIYREKTKRYPWQQMQLSEWALKYLRAYRDFVRSDDASNEKPLFVTLTGRRVNASDVEYHFKNWLEKDLGLDTGGFKILRHSKLTWMAVEGKELVEIAKYAGHSTPNPTLIYIHAASQFRKNPLAYIDWMKSSTIYDDAKEIILKWQAG